MLRWWRLRQERVTAAWDRARVMGLTFSQAQDGINAARKGSDPKPYFDAALAARETARQGMMRRS